MLYTFVSRMKKILAILLSVFYLAVTSGVAMTVHYCMGEVAAVGIGHNETDRCGDCGMENSGCCHDDIKIVKVSDFHGNPGQPSATFKSDFAGAPVEFPHRFGKTSFAVSPKRPSSHAPPDSGGRSLCILHCVYRI